MLLSIDLDRVKKKLREPPVELTLASANLEPTGPPLESPSAESVRVHSTVTGLPDSLQRARQRLLLLRQSLIASGVSPLTPDELEREIDKTRGRL
jgi:hypothetical protein